MCTIEVLSLPTEKSSYNVNIWLLFLTSVLIVPMLVQTHINWSDICAFTLEKNHTSVTSAMLGSHKVTAWRPINWYTQETSLCSSVISVLLPVEERQISRFTTTSFTLLVLHWSARNVEKSSLIGKSKVIRFSSVFCYVLFYFSFFVKNMRILCILQVFTKYTFLSHNEGYCILFL